MSYIHIYTNSHLSAKYLEFKGSVTTPHNTSECFENMTRSEPRTFVLAETVTQSIRVPL